MYKVLIADDEANVREGIRDNINWSELGFEFVGDFENGSDALDAVERLHPDVVFTDICMPFVDGLELARDILEKFPLTKIIILTGYDEFEYAQQAVKLKAYDYLLKPVTASELRKILHKIKSDLDDEIHKREDISRLKMQLKESLPVLRERFLNRMLLGHLQEDSLKDKLNYLNICLKGSNYIVAAIDVDDYSDLRRSHPGTEEELLLLAIYNVCDEIVTKYNGGIVFQNNNEDTIAILQSDNVEPMGEKAVNICEEIRQTIEKYLRFTVTIGLGTVCSSLKDIGISYKNSVKALDYRFLLGKNRVISICDITENLNAPCSYNREWEVKLASKVKIGTEQEIDGIISNLIQSLKVSFVSIKQCYIYIQHAIISIVDALNDFGDSNIQIFGNEYSPLTEIYTLKTLEEVEIYLREFCKKASCFFSNKRNNFIRIQAAKAEEYIKENYMDENISMKDICKHILMSPSYFSMIFKNITGETFIEYLTRIRIEKAMELLKGTDLKSYEIAHRVGYGDPHYFSLIFKKVTGMSPTEYR